MGYQPPRFHPTLSTYLNLFRALITAPGTLQGIINVPDAHFGMKDFNNLLIRRHFDTIFVNLLKFTQ